MKTEQRLKALGIELAKPTSPIANYVNAVRTGSSCTTPARCTPMSLPLRRAV